MQGDLHDTPGRQQSFLAVGSFSYGLDGAQGGNRPHQVVSELAALDRALLDHRQRPLRERVRCGLALQPPLEDALTVRQHLRGCFTLCSRDSACQQAEAPGHDPFLLEYAHTISIATPDRLLADSVLMLPRRPCALYQV